MAEQKYIRTVYDNGDIVLSNIRDKYTNESFTYSKVITYADGSAMDDAKCDGVIYRKLGDEYFKRNFTGAVNVKWFGAKGDGVTDDTEAIQKAVDLYKNIYLPTGIYMVSIVSLTAISSKISGDGIDKTVIKAIGNISTHPFEILNANNVNISGITFDGNGLNMVAPGVGDGAQSFVIYSSNNCSILKCSFKNAYNKTVVVIGSNNVFDSCVFLSDGNLNHNQDLIQIYGGVVNCNNNKIINCQFDDPIRASIYLEAHVTNTLISNNIFKNTIGFFGAVAINAQVFGDNLIVKNNTFENHKHDLLVRCGYKNFVFESNTCKLSTNSPVCIDGSQTVFELVKDETIFDTIKETISIGGNDYFYLCKTCSIKRNNVTFNSALTEGSSAGLVSLFGLSEERSYFENIIVSENLIYDSTGVLPNLIFSYIPTGISILNNLIVTENKCFKAVSALLNSPIIYPNQLSFIKNDFYKLRDAQSFFAIRKAEFSKNSIFEFNDDNSGSILFMSIFAELSILEDNFFIDGNINLLTDTKTNTEAPTAKIIINRNLKSNGNLLGIYEKPDFKKPDTNIQNKGLEVSNSANPISATFSQSEVQAILTELRELKLKLKDLQLISY